MIRGYRESYENYLLAFNTEESKKEYRYRIALPLKLFFDKELFFREQKCCTNNYRNICELVFRMIANRNRFRCFNSFLLNLEGEEYTWGYYNNDDEDLYEEQMKLLNQIIKMLY